MSNFYLENTWREKTDEEVFKAAENLKDYSKSIHPLIQSEVRRRKGLPSEALATEVSMPPKEQQANLKNPLSSWAWTFIIMNSVLAFLLISVGRYHWYFLLGDVALAWFIVLWAKQSPKAAKVLLFNFIVSFSAYHMAYILNLLKRPAPATWCVLVALGIWAFKSIWQVQQKYHSFLADQSSRHNAQGSA